MKNPLIDGLPLDPELKAEHLFSVLYPKGSVSYDVHVASIDDMKEVLLVCSHTGGVVASGMIAPDGSIDPVMYPEALANLMLSVTALASRMVYGRRVFTIDGKPVAMGHAFKGLQLWYMIPGHRESLKDFFDHGPMTDTTRGASAAVLKERLIIHWERKVVKNRDRLLAFSKGGPISPIGGTVHPLTSPAGTNAGAKRGQSYQRA
jgi:hypothetical protein